MHNFKDPLLPHITDRNCVFRECLVYLPLDVTSALSGYGENTKCMKGSSVLMSMTLISPKPSPWSTNTALSLSLLPSAVTNTPGYSATRATSEIPGVCPWSQKHTLAHGAVLIGLEGTASSTSSFQVPVTLI